MRSFRRFLLPAAVPALILPAVAASAVPAGQISVFVSDAGQGREYRVQAGTVSGFLATQGIALGKEDSVIPAAGEALEDRQLVVITRKASKLERATEAIPFTKVRQKAPVACAAGQASKVITKGKPGKKVRTWRLAYIDGKLVSRKLVSEQIAVKPVAEVMAACARKTAPAPASQAGKGLTPAGPVRSCEASHYWDPQPTASGEWFNPSAMTAAHKTLPLGSRVKVTNKANRKSVIVRINDRGPYITGRCLDLSKAAFMKIASPSQGVAQVNWQLVK